MTRNRPTPTSGFSLLELLAVTGLAMLMLGLAARACLAPPRHAAVDSAAREFCGAVREARLHALRGGTPVRIVFIPRSKTHRPPAEGEQDSWAECRLYQLTLPLAADREVRWREASNAHAVHDGDALERSPVAAPGLPECLVGQWKRLPIPPVRLQGPRGEPLTVEAPFLEDWRSGTPESYAQRHAWRPPLLWAPGARSSLPPGFHSASPFPASYARIPFPDGPPLVERPLPAEARVYDPQADSEVEASLFWPGPRRLFDLSGPPPELLFLPYIEISPRGEICTRGMEAGAVIFRDARDASLEAMVRLDRRGGFARLVAILP